MDSLTYAFPPSVVGAILHAANCRTGLHEFGGPYPVHQGSSSFAEEGQRKHFAPVPGILECKALGKPSFMLRGCSGFAEVSRW